MTVKLQTSRRCLQWSSQYRVVSEESAGGPGSLDLHHAQGLGQPPLQLLPAASADHLAEDLHSTTSYCYCLSQDTAYLVHGERGDVRVSEDLAPAAPHLLGLEIPAGGGGGDNQETPRPCHLRPWSTLTAGCSSSISPLDINSDYHFVTSNFSFQEAVRK